MLFGLADERCPKRSEIPGFRRIDGNDSGMGPPSIGPGTLDGGFSEDMLASDQAFV